MVKSGFVAAVALWFALLSGAAAGATLIVDTTSDSPSLQACTAAPGDCSLRGALIKTQRHPPGEDTIAFDISAASDPGCVAATGVCTITLSDSMDLRSLVPGIQTGPSQGFTIDGYSQPGASANTLPLGQGSNAQLRIKLVGPVGTARQIITATPFTIRGLIFQNIALIHERGDGGFGGNGHPDNLRYELYGNFFGYDADGVTGLDSPSLGGIAYVRITNLIRGVRVGSGDPADINLFGAGAQKPNFCLIILGENRVQGNFIGADRSGISGSGCLNGLQVSHEASPNRLPLDIGGAAPGQGNVIANHVLNAIDIIPAERDVLVRIRGNKIGIGVDGVTPAPNFNAGNSVCAPFAAIRGGFAQPGSAQIGGLAPGEGNLFGPNGRNRGRCPAPFAAPAPYMQTVAAGEGMGVWQVQGNRYVDMQGMAIDLVQDDDSNNSLPQRLPNDAGDADPLSANRRQNFPTISTFGVVGDQVSLTYRVDSTLANSRYPLSIEFLKDDGQGNLTPIGSDTYTAAVAQTDQAISFTLPAGISLGASDIVVATATTTGDSTPGENISGETSETSFYPLESFSLVSITPTTVPPGAPVTVRVRAIAAVGAPFKPNGRVLVQASNGTSPFEECTTLLAPVAAERTSEGECQFTANAPPGILGVRVSYNAAQSSFALADGRHPPSVLQTITVRDALVVDTTSDNVALQACTSAPNDCSLRGAIAAANANVEPDLIEFAIPTSEPGCNTGSGICQIEVGSSLSVTRPLTIDGYTQPGTQPNSIPAPGANNAQLKIEITSVGFANLGVALFNLTNADASPFSLRGLAIALPSTAIVTGGLRHDYRGNWFCIDALGQSPDFSQPCNVFSLGSFNRTIRVGGPNPADRNVIAGGGRDLSGAPGGGSNRLRVADFDLDASGELWAAALDSAWRRDLSGVWSVIPGGPELDVHWSTLRDAQGRRWFGARTRLALLEDGVLRTVPPELGLPVQPVRAILEDRDRQLWFATAGAGLYRLRGERFERVPGLRSDVIFALTEDGEGNLWAGTSSGVCRIRDGALANFGLTEGIGTDFVLSIHAAADGITYVGSNGRGLYAIESGAVRALGNPGGDPFVNYITGLRDRLLVSTNAGSFLYADGAYTALHPELGRRPVVFAAEDGDGVIWLRSGPKPLERLADGELSTVQTNADPARWGFSGRDGAVWVTVNQGLYRARGARVDKLLDLPASPVGACQVEDQRGVLWCTSGGSLLRVDVATRQVQSIRDPVIGQVALLALLGDDAAGLWVASTAGLFYASLADLDAAAKGAPTNLRRFDERHGMRSSEFARAYAPGLASRGVDGKHWWATLGGALVTDPKRLVNVGVEPSLAILRLQADRVVVPQAGWHALPPDVTQIQIDYGARSLTDAASLQLRHRLLPLSTDWVETESRQFVALGLPSGSYRFELQASLDRRQWQTASSDFTIQPHWHQRWWARALFVVLGIVLVVTLPLLRIAHLRRRAAELLHLVDERTAALKVANRQLDQIARTDALTGVANRRGFEEALQAVQEQAAQPLALLLVDVDHFKRYNDHYGHPAGDECLRLVAAAMQVVVQPRGALLARYGGEEFAVLLSGDMQAANLADALRAAVRALALPHVGNPPDDIVTVSIGLAQSSAAGETGEQLIRRADQALYSAKRSGRDCVGVA